MEKVWNADNSPFKGMPYDPSKYGQNPGNNGPSVPFNFWLILMCVILWKLCSYH